jgi:PEP-CTERM motif
MTERIHTLFPLASLRRAVTIAVAGLAVFGMAGTASGQVVGFGGSAMTGWTPNTNTAGVPSVTGTGTAADVLTLTTPVNSIASSYWFNTPQSITNFTETFTYTQTTNTPNGADGIAVVWQNAGLNALGAGGGGLGFGGITLSAALGMNIFGGNSGSGSQFNNATTANTGVATTPTPGTVNIASGNPINVALSYRQADNALTETMTDTVTNATFTRVWRGVNIQGQVGSTTALIGLTGATGGVNAGQTVTNFRYTPGAAIVTPVAAITPIAATGYNQNMIIPATGGSANVTATMDGGTALTGDTFYEMGANPNTPVSGVPRAGVTFGSGTDANHAFVLQPNGAGQNNAVMLDQTHALGTLSLTTPARFAKLSFLVAGGNGGAPINLTIHYAGGGTQSATINGLDWFNNTPIAVDANGRVNTALSDFNNINNGNPRMYQQDLDLTNLSNNVLSVDFSWGGSGNDREVIFGLSGQPVPEPSSLGLIALGAIGFAVRRLRSTRGK